MSYKIGLILSLVFLINFFVFAIDIMSLQAVYSALDSKAVTIGYLLSQEGAINEDIIKVIEEKYNITFTCEDNCVARYGDVVTYTVATTYQPIIISKDEMSIKVRRAAVMGYFK
jgi:hypothetical protein